MKKEKPSRPRWSDEVGAELDELRRAGDQLDEAVALQFGLNRTDLRCLGILYRRGRVTAGELAERERPHAGGDHHRARPAGAGRVREPGAPTRPTAAACSWSPRSRRARSAPASKARSSSPHARCSTEREAAELTVIRDYLRGTRSVYEGADRRAHGGGGAGAGAGRGRRRRGRARAAPRWRACAAGRLEFTKGAAKVKLRGDGSLTELYRATLRGPGARDHRQRRHGHRAAAPPLSPLRLARPVGRLRPLDRRAVGHLAARRHVEARRRPQRRCGVTALEVTGGASDIEVRLPRPSARCRYACRAAPARSLLHRPAGAEARAEVSGGASQLVFDGQRLGAVGGRTVLASGGFADGGRPLRDPVHRRRQPGDGRDRLTRAGRGPDRHRRRGRLWRVRAVGRYGVVTQCRFSTEEESWSRPSSRHRRLALGRLRAARVRRRPSRARGAPRTWLPSPRRCRRVGAGRRRVRPGRAPRLSTRHALARLPCRRGRRPPPANCPAGRGPASVSPAGSRRLSAGERRPAHLDRVRTAGAAYGLPVRAPECAASTASVVGQATAAGLPAWQEAGEPVPRPSLPRGCRLGQDAGGSAISAGRSRAPRRRSARSPMSGSSWGLGRHTGRRPAVYRENLKVLSVDPRRVPDAPSGPSSTSCRRTTAAFSHPQIAPHGDWFLRGRQAVTCA